jgi:hypothetical protein
MDPEGINIIQKLLGNDIFNIVTALIALGAAISAAFPSKIAKTGWFGQALQFILDIANALGINFAKAKNADDQ